MDMMAKGPSLTYRHQDAIHTIKLDQTAPCVFEGQSDKALCPKAELCRFSNHKMIMQNNIQSRRSPVDLLRHIYVFGTWGRITGGMIVNKD